MLFEVAPYIAIFLIILIGGKSSNIAVYFLVAIQSITILNDTLMILYYEWLMILFAYISLFMARISINRSVIAYILYSLAYFCIGLESIFTYSGVLDSAYSYIMLALLMLLVVTVEHDRMDNVEYGSDRALP